MNVLMSTQAGTTRLQRLLETPSLSIAEFKEVINQNPGLSACVLKIINSPFFGLETKMNDAARAVDLLGTGQIQELLLQQLAIIPPAFSGNQTRLPPRRLTFSEKFSA